MLPKEGDKVRVVTKEATYEGILMPRPGILDKNITVIKLDNGYNIGIKNEKIVKTELASEYKPTQQKKEKTVFNKELPTVSVLSFGGTISSKVDYRTGGTYADYTAEDFVQLMPELKDVANINPKKVMGLMSEDFTPEEWRIMARAAAKELNSDARGVVISQGTDTLHFSTAAISFMLRNLNKPVLFTAAQRSIDRGSSDAFMNLSASIIAAARFDGAEVMTCLHGSTEDNFCILIRGTKVRKMHTSRRDAFRPINELPLAKVIDGKIEKINTNYRQRGKGKVELDDKFEEKTALVLVYPGMEPRLIDFYVKQGYKGIVLAATALGHVPTDTSRKNILPNIKSALDSGVPVVVATQTIYGRVHPFVYTNLRKLSVDLSCIFAEDMLPEVAYVKLGWVLGHTTKMEKVKEMMLTNYAGEITERTDEKSFLY
jgi:glutamyl-tRNA(Gln) amidotransferase subunit D